MTRLVEHMVRAVRRGFTPRSVYETTLTYHPGSQVKVNKDTVGKDNTGGDVSIPGGTVVSVTGVGGGTSGHDFVVALPDGKQVTVPFMDIGESMLVRSRRKVREDDDDDNYKKDKKEAAGDICPNCGSADVVSQGSVGGGSALKCKDCGNEYTVPKEFEDSSDDDKDENGDDDRNEDGDDKDEDDDTRVVRVSLAKPLSAEAEDWLKQGYKESGVELPSMPEHDEPDSVSFLMKAKDQEDLAKAIGELKDVAAENIQKVEPASSEDWDECQDKM